jgi:hypothetical protein
VLEFLAVRRQPGYRLWLSPKGLAPLLSYLRDVGALVTPTAGEPSGPAGDLLATYKAYLVVERGLASATVVSYLHVARLFLAGRQELADLGLPLLSAGEVVAFVQAECQGRSVGSAKYIVTGLRSLLRFCYLDDRLAEP